MIFIFTKTTLLFYPLIKWFVNNVPLPRRGLKYFLKLLDITGNRNSSFTKKLHNGLLMELYPSDHIQKQILWYGYYEKELVLCWEHFVRPGTVTLDIGANAGYYALAAAPISGKSMVFAFEPNPKTFRQLERNIFLNKITNIIPVQLGISSLNEESDFYISDEGNTGMSGLSAPEHVQEKISIRLMALDKWLEQEKPGPVGLVKMDIEGAEVAALRGMGGMLEKDAPVVFIEVCGELLERFDNRVEEVYEILGGYGYKGYDVITSRRLKPVSTPVEGDLVVFIHRESKIPKEIEIS